MTQVAESPYSFERRCLAAIAVLGLAPVVMCVLWVVVARVVGVQGELSAPTIILSGTLLSLCAVLPGALIGRLGKPGYQLTLAIAVFGAALVAALAVAGRQWWCLFPVLLIVGLGSGWGFSRVIAWLPVSFDGRVRRHPVLTGLWLLTALLAVVQSNRMSVFMTDSSELGYSLMPGLEFVERHSCFTSYVHGASVAQAGLENVYDYDAAPPPAMAVDVSPFHRDRYNYPPPFLLLPRLLLTVTHDFAVLRAVWYALTVLIMVAGWAIAMGWLDDRHRRQMVKLLPLFWISMPIQFTLQIGNFHIGAVFLAIVAMIAIEHRRFASGGSLLAFATLSKFSPGMLVLLLLVQRNLRAAAWTIGFGIVLCLAVVPVFGVAPWEAFFGYHLPRIQSGEALSFLDRSLGEIANNFSAFGIPFKFQQLGFDVGWDEARTFGNVYSVFLIIVAIAAGLRLGRGNRGHALCVWLALLTLGALRSPFAPPHVLVGWMWVLVLLSGDLRSKWQVAGFAALWLLFTVYFPMESVVPAILLSLFRQTIVFGGLTWLALRRAPSHSVAEAH